MYKLGFCLLALTFGIPAAAQEFNLSDARILVAELHGLARFHTGDDPHWSEPGFDDSAWPLVRIDQPWTAQGFTSDSGFAWYRFRIVAPPGHPHLGFYYPNPYDCYEIFVGGRLVAKYGNMPPNPRVLQGDFYQPAVQRIPDKVLPAGRPACPGGPARVALAVLDLHPTRALSATFPR